MATQEDLLEQAEQVRTQTEENANTADLVGGVLRGIINFFSSLHLQVTNAIATVSGNLTALVDRVTTIEAASWVTGSRIANGAVTTAKIANGSVTNAKLAGNSVGSNNIQDAAVGNLQLDIEAVETSNIKDQAVTTDKIKDGAVDGAKIAIRSVSTELLKDQAVTSTKIGDGAVTSDKIGEGALRPTHFSNGCIDGSRHLMGESVTGDKIADAAIETFHLKNGAVTRDKLHNNLILELKQEMADPSDYIWSTIVENQIVGPTFISYQNRAEYAPIPIHLLQGDRITVYDGGYAVNPLCIWQSDNVGNADHVLKVEEGSDGLSYIAEENCYVVIGLWTEAAATSSAVMSYKLERSVSMAILLLAQEKQDKLDFDQVPTQGSPNLLPSGAIYTALNSVINNDLNLVVDSAPSGGTFSNAAVGNYYVFTTDVTALTITLPAPPVGTKVKGMCFFFHTGTMTGLITATCADGASPVVWYDGFSSEDNTTYEINFVWNGWAWVGSYGIVTGLPAYPSAATEEEEST